MMGRHAKLCYQVENGLGVVWLESNEDFQCKELPSSFHICYQSHASISSWESEGMMAGGRSINALWMLVKRENEGRTKVLSICSWQPYLTHSPVSLKAPLHTVTGEGVVLGKLGCDRMGVVVGGQYPPEGLDPWEGLDPCEGSEVPQPGLEPCEGSEVPPGFDP